MPTPAPRAVEELAGLEAQHPELRDPNSPTVRVGGVVSDRFEKTRHPGILRAREGFIAWQDLEPMLQRLEAAISQHDRPGVRRVLASVTDGGGGVSVLGDSVPARADRDGGSRA